VSSCPRCGVEIRADRRFTTWCAACDWNVDPQQSDAEKKRGLERVRRRLARRYGERLFAELSGVDGRRPRSGRTASGLLAYTIALAVHGVTVALAAGGVWFVVNGWGGIGMVPGLLLTALAWSLRPRLNRLPRNAHVLLRNDAPELYALIDEVARAVGARGVDVVIVDDEPNASVTQLGVRRRLLTLGLPLWEVLTPQERIALLGHEFGHFTLGDTRHGMVVGSAYNSLVTWHYYVEPAEDSQVVEVIANVLYFLPRWLIAGVVMLLDLLTSQASQRSEYLADSAAAHTGSTQAAVGLMDRLLVTNSVVTALHRETNSRRMRGGVRVSAQDADGLWEALAAHMASIPESEYERQRRAGALRGHSVDASHPPTHLRRRLLLARTPVPASVTADADRADRIVAELADVRTALARDVVRDGYGY